MSSRLTSLSAVKWQWLNNPNWVDYADDIAKKFEEGYKSKNKADKKVKVDAERFLDLTVPVPAFNSSSLSGGWQACC